MHGQKTSVQSNHLSSKLHIQKCDAKINGHSWQNIGGDYSPLSPLVPTPMHSEDPLVVQFDKAYRAIEENLIQIVCV